MPTTIRRTLTVLTATTTALALLLPAAGAAEQTFCVYVNDRTIICIDDDA